MKEIDIWQLFSSYRLVKEVRITHVKPSKNNHVLNDTAWALDARGTKSKEIMVD